MTRAHLTPRLLAPLLLVLAGAPHAAAQNAGQFPLAGERIQLLNREEVNKALAELYPQNLREKGLRAEVELMLGVARGGALADVVLERGSCLPYYDEVARRAAALMRFAPDTAAGAGPLRATRARITFAIDSAHLQLSGDSLPRRTGAGPGGALLTYRTAPALLNVEEVRRLLTQYYPASARSHRAGGTTLVWVLVDTTGAVRQRQIRRGSGRCDLDVAALRVALEMRFAPGRGESGPVMVWSQVPIVWQAR